MKHEELKGVAIRWLYERGCTAFAEEVETNNGIADALGVKRFRSGGTRYDVYYIEAKASRSDLICKKQRRIYEQACTLEGMMGNWPHHIDFYYLVVSDGVKVENSLYPRFGVLNEHGVVVRKASRFKTDRTGGEHMARIAHRLVYQVYGKMYLGEFKSINIPKNTYEGLQSIQQGSEM